VVVGNTCMHHLLLGIDPSHVGLAPYAPVMRHAAVLPARELPLKIAPEARVCLLPLVAGFVGADAVAVALATRLADSPALRVAVDIGTNGEVLLGSRDSLPPALRGRVAMRGEERVLVVLRPGEAGARAEIVLTQDDVRQVQLAKGAIAAGIAMLLHVATVPLERVEELLLAGGFGNYLSILSAIRIGLLPAPPVGRVRYVGNAASLGAQLCLLSEAERARRDPLPSRR